MTEDVLDDLAHQLDSDDDECVDSDAGKKIIIDNKGDKYIIFRPNDNFKSKWDLLIMLFAIFNCIFVPL